jgi:signal transduction histidine kinase
MSPGTKLPFQSIKGKRAALRILLIIVASIFAVEMAIMLTLFHSLPSALNITDALMDSSGLIVVLYPALYLLVYRPLISEIGERTQAEARLEKAQGELERRVAERTDELAKANDLMQEYVHTISHDLRNPLAVIQGRALMLKRYSDRPQMTEQSIDAIEVSAYRMKLMIDDLVDSARLETRQLHIVKQPLHFPEFMVSLLNRTAGALDTGRVRLAVPADLPTVYADPDRLERVMLNLLTNAFKYSASDAEVIIRAKTIGEEIEVSVADLGIGIAPDDLPHVFDRFFRAGGVRKADGLGLGLYITRMLIEAQGGRISVQSELSKGSTFLFTLPTMSDYGATQLDV